MAPKVEIGFPTKDRWEDVKVTLDHLARFGLGHLRILIFDDGSDTPCPYDVTTICPGAELTRFPESKGMIVRRNQIAREMKSKYYFGLDDDSYPVSGSLDEAVRFADSRDDLFSLSFPIYNPRLEQHQSQSISSTPYPVRSFLGCGHLMRRQRFLDLGGFQEGFGYFLEEPEVSTRALLAGLRCIHFPDLLIHHTYSQTARNWQRMDYYGARNVVLWNDWYVPKGHRLIKQMRTTASRILQTIRTRRGGALAGHLAGLKEIRGLQKHRHFLSPDQFKELQSLQHT